jgi:hypothetical protein
MSTTLRLSYVGQMLTFLVLPSHVFVRPTLSKDAGGQCLTIMDYGLIFLVSGDNLSPFVYYCHTWV